MCVVCCKRGGSRLSFYLFLTKTSTAIQEYEQSSMPSKLGDNPEMTDSAAGFDLDQLVGTDSLSKVRIVLFNYLLTK